MRFFCWILEGDYRLFHGEDSKNTFFTCELKAGFTVFKSTQTLFELSKLTLKIQLFFFPPFQAVKINSFLESNDFITF